MTATNAIAPIFASFVIGIVVLFMVDMSQSAQTADLAAQVHALEQETSQLRARLEVVMMSSVDSLAALEGRVTALEASRAAVTPVAGGKRVAPVFSRGFTAK